MDKNDYAMRAIGHTLSRLSIAKHTWYLFGYDCENEWKWFKERYGTNLGL